MKRTVFMLGAAVFLNGCAPTYEMLRAEARKDSNETLCMAQIVMPNRAQVARDELASRNAPECDWNKAHIMAREFYLQYSARQQAPDPGAMAAAMQLLQMSGPRSYAPPAPAPSWTPTGFLQSQNVNGTLRYCRYSNGVVMTISSVSMCPMNTN